MLATDKGVAYLTLLFSGDFNNWGLGLVSNIILETFSGEKLIIGDFYQCIMDVVGVFYELQLFTMRERLIIERSCLLLSNVY